MTLIVGITLGAVVLLFVGLSSPAVARQECELYKPVAGQDIETAYSGEIEAGLNRILGISSISGDIEVEYRRFERDTLSEYDQPMRMFALRSLIHLKCVQSDGPVDSQELADLFNALLLSPEQGAAQNADTTPTNVTSTGPCSPVANNSSGDVSISVTGSCN
jgi:hypothetical protein